MKKIIVVDYRIDKKVKNKNGSRQNVFEWWWQMTIWWLNRVVYKMAIKNSIKYGISKVVVDRKVSDRRDIDKMLANKLVDNEVALNNLVVDIMVIYKM